MAKATHMADPGIFLAGTFLSAKGGTRAPIEDLACKFREHRYRLFTASPHHSRWLRVPHLFVAAGWFRPRVSVAIVDLYSGPAFLWGAGVAGILRRLDCPVILALHGGALPEFAQRRPELVSKHLRQAAAVIAPSRYLVETMKPYRSDIRLVPNPVPVESFGFRQRTSVEPRLVWVRGFHSIYNPEMAVTALSLIRKEFPQARLTMVGGNRGDESLTGTERAIERLGLRDAVTMAGPRARIEVPSLLQRGDIFLNTSNVDNTPLSVLEAMACGLCVVSTNVGGIPYLLEQEQDALLVPPNDPVAMAAAVVRLLQDRELAARLSTNGRQKAEGFGWSSIFPLWEELVLSLVAGGRRV